MANMKDAQKYALRAKPIRYGGDLKGFFLEIDDFTFLLNALSEQDEEDE